MAHDKEYSASGSEISLATDAALECLAWSTPDYENPLGECLDAYGFEWSERSREEMRALVDGFIEANSDDLDGLDYEQIGHDFILTANRHGAGFWDRGLGERGERLTEMAHPYGEISAYANIENETLELEY